MTDEEGASKRPMTLGEARQVLDSGAFVCDVDVVAAALGMSTWAYYEAVRSGAAPVMPIKVGRRQKYRVSDVRALLGLPAAEVVAQSAAQ